MNPDQIEAVSTSFAMIGDGAELAGVFYEELFTARPDLREMFPADMAAQRRKFVDGLREIVATVNRFEDFEARVEALGALHHHEYGVRAEHFPPVRDALLNAFRVTLDAEFTERAAESWIAAFDLVAETMMEGAARGTDRDVSAP